MKKINKLTPEDIDKLSQEDLDELSGEELDADIAKFKGPPKTKDELKAMHLLKAAMERVKRERK